MISIADLNALAENEAVAGFLACCGSRLWAQQMSARRPFKDAAAVHAAADGVFAGLRDADWLEAFAAHPQIGERASAADRTAAWSRDEQKGATQSDEATLTALREGNRAYREQFGFIYLVCATGKSARELLGLLQARLLNTPAQELRCAASEQEKITHLRLNKWVQA